MLAPQATAGVLSTVRESSSENKAALQSQADGLKAYASARGYQIVHVVREVASGTSTCWLSSTRTA